MDEREFKKTLRSVNPLGCVFEKTILSRNGGCEHMVKHNIAEREAVGCGSEAGHLLCLSWLDLTRDKSVFALGIAERSGRLPHAKALRLQVGGLRGLRSALYPDVGAQAPVENIHGLIMRAQQVFGSLHDLPYQEIVKAVSAFTGRRRPARHRPGN